MNFPFSDKKKIFSWTEICRIKTHQILNIKNSLTIRNRFIRYVFMIYEQMTTIESLIKMCLLTVEIGVKN